jgi:formylglycine-generating enzyme required for sulfatase activity
VTDFLIQKWWLALVIVGALAVGALMVMSGSDEDPCPDGMERTADTEGQCCWAGQTYLEDRCVGVPTSCPEGMTVSESDQACVHPPCEGGRVRTPDGVHCCWEGQGWSQTREQCVGVPTSCPSGLALSGEDCVISAPEGFVVIEAGTFVMGSPEDEEHRNAERENAQEVTIPRPFLLKDTPVTQGEWMEMTTDPATGVRTNPNRFRDCGDDCPVESVNWYEAITYLNWLSEQEGLEACYEIQCRGDLGLGCTTPEAQPTNCVGAYQCSSVEFKGLDCEGYRLPTQAEWEFAARAGTTSATYGSLDSIAWYSSNSGFETKPVRGKEPNAWGLYDMFGNVSEFTNDFIRQPTNTEGPTTFSDTGPVLIRGCSYGDTAMNCRAAASEITGAVFLSSTIGFRPARSLP